MFSVVSEEHSQLEIKPVFQDKTRANTVCEAHSHKLSELRLKSLVSVFT